MDNQTKILLDRIYEKMKTVDESIDEKSQRLFKIRDDLSKLSEQSRMLQFEIDQLSTHQADTMREFILLCEHLDTRPVQNSILKGSIIPNKVAGDVPLAPSAKNISTVNSNMPISESKDKEKSRENEATSSSSAIAEKMRAECSPPAKAEKFISGKPEIEKIKDFNVKATGVDKKLPHLNKKWIQTRRALGIKALYAILTRFYKEDCKIIDQDSDWVLITKGKGKSKELKERILDIELHRLGATEETWKLACKMLDHDHAHT
uniref:Uncharacterized protein n=1 Tax=Solanum tuberosum TaxID=4113 RepID=M1AQK3_SOLTU